MYVGSIKKKDRSKILSYTLKMEIQASIISIVLSRVGGTGGPGLEILFFYLLNIFFWPPPKSMTNDVYLTPIVENLH